MTSHLALLTGVLIVSAIGSRDARAQQTPSFEGVTIVFRVSGPDWEKTATHYYTASKVSFDQGDAATVVDLATGRIVMMSMTKKQYSETTFVEIEQAMTSVSAQMEKAMAGIPEGLRKKMMGDAERDVALTKGDIRTVASVSCQNYVVALGEKTRMETCAALAFDPPFDRAHLRNLALVTAPIAKGHSGLNKMVEKLREIPGLSLASSMALSLMGRKIETSTEATQIRRGPIDGAHFEIPQDFQKIDSPFAKMAR